MPTAPWQNGIFILRAAGAANDNALRHPCRHVRIWTPHAGRNRGGLAGDAGPAQRAGVIEWQRPSGDRGRPDRGNDGVWIMRRAHRCSAHPHAPAHFAELQNGTSQALADDR